MTTHQYAVTVTATGEVRDTNGRFVETVHATQTVDVPVEQLQSFTDDQLRAAGLDDTAIAQIRSTP